MYAHILGTKKVGSYKPQENPVEPKIFKSDIYNHPAKIDIGKWSGDSVIEKKKCVVIVTYYKSADSNKSGTGHPTVRIYSNRIEFCDENDNILSKITMHFRKNRIDLRYNNNVYSTLPHIYARHHKPLHGIIPTTMKKLMQIFTQKTVFMGMNFFAQTNNYSYSFPDDKKVPPGNRVIINMMQSVNYKDTNIMSIRNGYIKALGKKYCIVEAPDFVMTQKQRQLVLSKSAWSRIYEWVLEQPDGTDFRKTECPVKKNDTNKDSYLVPKEIEFAKSVHSSMPASAKLNQFLVHWPGVELPETFPLQACIRCWETVGGTKNGRPGCTCCDCGKCLDCRCPEDGW